MEKHIFYTAVVYSFQNTMNKPKILGKVDLKTGTIYDNNGKVVHKQKHNSYQGDFSKRLEEIRQSRQAFFTWF